MKPTIPQGTRDFSAETVHKRNYILNTIRNAFELAGYEPLETPAFENMETLVGKYGDEGDQLIFKILNNGLNRSEKHESARNALEEVLKGKNTKNLTERALKYDLTIPFARYVAMHSGQLTMPYKRYQIQPVWRADRPQRGRYREFTQCDADVVGSVSLLNELELISIYNSVFEKLNIDVAICINNRKILTALAQLCNEEERITDITVALDKLDKIGLDKVLEELQLKNINEQGIQIVKQYIELNNLNNNEHIIRALQILFANNKIGLEGIEELKFIFALNKEIKIDVTLARGLNYYTGTILEVKPMHIQMGSIGGGGRYDNLTGLFGVPNIAGVGISFGVDRIYDVMEEKNLFPEQLYSNLKVLLVNFGDAYLGKNLEIISLLRRNKISASLYPDTVKFDKQLKYASKKNVNYVIMIGENELNENKITVKNFVSGEQFSTQLDNLLEIIQK